ncbi:hexitol phosphatase HxpB [Vibrio fluvialis]|nr:hexitol phosphatase HxpB [Vibrio fluvialis]HDM8036248.1 hexitol phosphatase HxpB [Vibrio fluvialis clinical-1]EKO3521885.1 hexitol phosphatase HxpB [Vibrio fluvialis]EKO3525081.1 hexitol phosphatase HxpB [Vibrio fluvialis]EKO3530225.1 hexitol phosphatase HxpB [Vibrio fluvialis]
MNKKAVIFDMDGVIIDSEPLWQEAQIESLAGFGVAITRLDCEQLTMGKRIDEIARTWCQTYSLAVDSEVLETLILTKLCQRISATGEAMAGVYDALHFFAERGLNIALATSSNHVVIKAVFDRLALWDKFSVICSAEDEKHGKPQPDVYLTAARKLNVAVSDCLVIEDSFTGLTAAKRAGMTTYLVSPESQQDKFAIADAQFLDLNAVIASLRNAIVA